MFTAFSDMSVQAKDLNKRVIFSKTVNKIKGIQLDFAQAENDSYQQAIKEVKESIIPEFVNSFIKD
jgi:hypothetical protein